LTFIIRVKPRAEREITAAAKWWHQNRPAAPGAIAVDLKEALGLLVEFPRIGTKVEGARDPETRRWWLDRVRYHVYYRTAGQYLDVIAFWGGGREHEPKV
jgi:plasmid stabilization system protein ParE